MDPVFRFPASPGTPLFPVSPERANRLQLPQSPSLPSISNIQNDPFIVHSRGNSDVQGKVAQFNNLSKEAAQRRKDSEAALKRAVLGREEAESETRRLREENRLLRQDVEEGRARERKVGERLEGVMEELQGSKETQAHAQTIYEKEVRRARKEAFKSSSALVKLQEELKSTRNKYTLMREEVDVQRRKVNTREQETFAAQHQLVELQEEMEKQKQQDKIIEKERDTLKTSLIDEEAARPVVEGAIALPLSTDGENFASPRKRSRRSESMKENVDPEAPRSQDQLESVKDQLRMEKRMRLRADDQINFMKMECQFQCCSCRIAQRQGIQYVHDDTLATQMVEIASKIAGELEKPAPQPVTESLPEHIVQPIPASAQDQPPSTPPRQPSLQRENTDQDLLNFSPTTGTFYKVPSPIKPSFSPPTQETPKPSIQAPQSTPQATNLPSLHTSPIEPTPSFTFPHTPRPLPIPPPRTISYTKTVTIPLKDDLPFTPAPATPGGISREDALEQIRQRRGRARSIAAGNGTPRKRMVDVAELRRDISAPGRV
ncbi:hypothetical protein HO173_003439 [Letharia columbiana]|uniref:Uncharacterized protein n=1 Tax=Letharia columbiana TaxID=112416 RepID=A0A8H6G0W7_9LECA|nr:uncharacterized protein HO173_003439 [Letharia columbiana]KAF6238471.1 hypothetical protein HO173_003439 [Letharia columbiana]